MQTETISNSDKREFCSLNISQIAKKKTRERERDCVLGLGNHWDLQTKTKAEKVPGNVHLSSWFLCTSASYLLADEHSLLLSSMMEK